MKSKKLNAKHIVLLIILILAISMWSYVFVTFRNQLIAVYDSLESTIVYDRNGEIISVSRNAKGYYAIYNDYIPNELEHYLLKKEDRYFYYHFGINPISTARAVMNKLTTGKYGSSSTITQQLTKNLLFNETDRTLSNKLMEYVYSLSLEASMSKKDILKMYSNTVYLGNQVQGFSTASDAYYNLPLDTMSNENNLNLIATLSAPSIYNPLMAPSNGRTKKIAENLKIDLSKSYSHTPSTPRSYLRNDAYFEMSTLIPNCLNNCKTTIDIDLTEKLRKTLNRTVENLYDSGVQSGAIVVIKVPENEILAIIGSPDPLSTLEGHQINMALEPRPIGSTSKPLIHLKGFEKGIRPYSLVEDKEYKYPIASGFSIYPSNYDGQYHGTVTIREALAGSLNVPSVKVLEHVGLTEFYDFLTAKLGFLPLRDLGTYQYGIALGGLDMDLLTLTYLFTLFPAQGELNPLVLQLDADKGIINTPMTRFISQRQVAEPKYVQLVTSILSDRISGIEQFGLRSNLNLPYDNYAVKTGTSRDYHDSWTIGYTPDFVVGVWVGNAQNEPTDHISGQKGAGLIWHNSMEILLNSEYNSGKAFDFSELLEHRLDGSLVVGLRDDDLSYHRSILENDDFIISPHPGDTFEQSRTNSIPLKANHSVSWYINEDFLGTGQNIPFRPRNVGRYSIRAESELNGNSIIVIHVVE